MKQISVREFQLHAEKYLKELPIVLTRYGVPVAIVSTDFTTEATYGEVKRTSPTPPDKDEVFKKLKEQIEAPHPKEDEFYGKSEVEVAIEEEKVIYSKDY